MLLFVLLMASAAAALSPPRPWRSPYAHYYSSAGEHSPSTPYYYPANEYEYSVRREQLKQAERRLEGKMDPLTKEERLVDHYLQHLKWREFQRTKDRFLPALSINETTIEDITSSKVYEALRTMPKGGSMHTHELHDVSRKEVLDILWESEDFRFLWMTNESHPKPWRLDFSTQRPGDNWERLQESSFTKEQILEKQTLLGIMSQYARANPTNSGQRWREMDPIWGRMNSVFSHVETKRRYLQALYRKNLAEGVQYIETREAVGLFRMYTLDANATNTTDGRMYVEDEDNAGEYDIELTKKTLAEFIKDNPTFIGHKRITYATRRSVAEDMQRSMDRALRLHRKYPDHLLGFDMVGEEDAGNSHIFYLENFLNEYDGKTRQSRMPFYQHTAETNWPGDLISSKNALDPVATLQNTYEAVLLGSKRVGHGLGYIKHPYLLQLLKERDVAIEICPVSNQILGYMADLRTHPAIHYVRAGLAVVLGTDDPGSFGYDHFTIDWYMVFMAWGLDLLHLKRLAVNSLRYSGMTARERDSALGKFNAAWQQYIEKTKSEACKADSLADWQPVLGRILPREGLKTGGTKVHVFGRNFDSAIKTLCAADASSSPKCRFGEVETRATYVSNHHLVCVAPPRAENSGIAVNVSVSLEAEKWLSTGQQFTYSHEEIANAGPSHHHYRANSALAGLVLVVSHVILNWR